jgi:hypothetical protein
VQDGDIFEAEKKAQIKRAIKGREMAAERLLQKCLKSGIGALIKNSDQKEVWLDLKGLILKAADMSYSLWTQKIYLVTKDINDEEIGEVFTHDNSMVEPHQLQNKYLDEDPNYWDGARILMVTHPALVRHGDEDATDFGVRTTLKKATCWMAQPAEGLT